ncbi:MAG: hypothetical protein MUE96_12155 [Bacteroidia bacterium]|jgi:hypothetical protein|nr:hypothetical protein [Bacteroidia bacterium]
MKRITKFLGIAIMIAACGSSTNITGVWRNPQVATQTYSNICVAAITESNSNKLIVEQAMTMRLKENGVQSKQMNQVFPYKFSGAQQEKDLILEKVRAEQSDGILTFALIKQKEETRYVPGGATYAPPMNYGYYGTFGGYYGAYGPRMYEPGYYVQDDIYFIETNLYDVATEKLVWSVQSKTYNPANIQQFADDFTAAITRELIKSKIIMPQKP